MFTKASLIRGWFAGATVFTCFSLGSYVGEQDFHGSKIPWLISVFIAFFICWGARSSLRHLR
ncbi:hypothetical protein GA0061071_105130 [Kosakonia oryzendophytica]|uniref:Uncharacterized protein n=1 Tax=Kosakonia oryzendophytica TaxID=1005665 RepID=A0A1C4BKR3_9ENTR|nr:hypothetical protein [Kosakonia oryzendophytica]AMO49650.1 Hypothetical protein AKI40_3270 [Enterobacter sp. FY-07]TDT59473.1 hypothetical protein DFO53_1054 [Enterobacter sp. AG5470]WBT60417.1 hypothetical protein O9K67_11870 [Kosakonia oryzendophytica]SCC07437.1 hypothetical protein GA0061071_105130 [Kosakonia oryzendophytica]